MKATMITLLDILDLEDAAAALYRAGAYTEAICISAKALRWRGELEAFRCDIDESAGMAEVIELNGYSRKAPCV